MPRGQDGSIIGDAVAPTGGESGVASGIWTMSEVHKYKTEGNWPVPLPFVIATGPSSAGGVEDGDYKYHVFTTTVAGGDGFVVSNAGDSTGSNTLEYLIVAGGGSGRTATTGGGYGRGGGGAGGYRWATDMACPAKGNHAVTVGAAGSSAGFTSGGDSVFNGITATGGGKGGGDGNAGDGGSGGGGQGLLEGETDYGTGGDGVYDGVTIGTATWQGRDGGDGVDTTGGGGAGGGGASGEPADATATAGSAGGAGVENLIGTTLYGVSGYYAGGGGGAGYEIAPGGTGGGGASGKSADSADATPGTASTGGGGGGGSYSGYGAGADGGGGIVIIRYKFQ